ncbi:unnamed protein product [Paramecium octaurelia]|uniref:RING-type domain-containing protein n=1 Tax=Paramecium octaurelia TaxID=43137 RepID=A0A8S1UIV3_PAROT|nr:unnamed protein product [Paramecium octaurelia]
MGGCDSSAASKDCVQAMPSRSQCYHCKRNGQNLLKAACGHVYHEICLISKRNDSNKCNCGKEIGQLNKIDEKVHQLFLSYQAQVIVQRNQNKLQMNEKKQQQFFHCPKKGCSFYFIQDQKPGQAYNLEYFCDQCNIKLRYDQKKSDNINEISNAQTNQQQVLSQQSTKTKIDPQEQLQLLIEANQQQFTFCKNNCGFVYIENNSYDTSNSLCENCDYCHKCTRQLFSDFISIKNCKHRFHLLCANTLIINPDKLESLKCKCERLIDDEDIKIELNIKCIICGKYDTNLKKLPCNHYIHLDCIFDNSIQFSDFRCCICKIPILEFLQSPQHKHIHDKIKIKNIERMLMQIENDCFICYSQTEEALLNTQCNHKVHSSCLKRRQSEINDKQQFLSCSCGTQIIDLRPKIK